MENHKVILPNIKCNPVSEPTQRSSSLSAIPFARERRRSNKSRRCWFGCIWFSRVSLMGSAVSTSSSPEPEEGSSILEQINYMINEKPIKMGHMIKVTKYINNSTFDEKTAMFDCGVIHTLLDLISDAAATENNNGSSSSRNGSENRRKHRRNSSSSMSQRGTGYGHGSTRSRWDIERTVEERLAREEQLTWLLNSLNAFLVGWPLGENFNKSPADLPHISPSAIQLIANSTIISVLEYNLRNDSVFDVSEHLELYQSLLETAACMAVVPGLLSYLVKPYHPNAKSIARQLIPQFKKNIIAFDDRWRGQMGSPDFRMIEFINRVNVLSNFIEKAAESYESSLPDEERKEYCGEPSTESSICDETEDETPNDVDSDDATYRKNMKLLQIQTYKFYGDFGKLVVPYTFKKEARNINPFSPSLRERTKRIAKELASMANALPLNASNSIFVCVDESRCDIIKVLISGPDDTPYANGLFEFDIFFPTGYPFSPPKCAFLTTGAGNVRFNPNLYNDGKICLSILGTWEGRPEEKWNPYCSLMQVLVSIQGLIFVKDPYFNEPGFEKYQGTDKGEDYSKKYNLQIEHATLNYAIREQFRNPPAHFKEVIQKHFWQKRHAIVEQAQKWITDMRNDMAESEKNPKKKDVISFESAYNPFQQERVVQQLIQEFTHMHNPFKDELKDA